METILETGKLGMIFLKNFKIEPKCFSCGEEITEKNFGGIAKDRVSCRNIICLMQLVEPQKEKNMTKNETCKRCGRTPSEEKNQGQSLIFAKEEILSNGLCRRCDEVLYGNKEKKEENIPWKPYHPYRRDLPYPDFPSRQQIWC